MTKKLDWFFRVFRGERQTHDADDDVGELTNHLIKSVVIALQRFAAWSL